MKKILRFNTSNNGKIKEATSIMNDIVVVATNYESEEIQSIDPLEVSREKIRKLSNMTIQPYMVEDTGLMIEDMNGFPGALIKYYLDSLKSEGICTLNGNSKATHVSCSHLINNDKTTDFTVKIEGTIASEPRGTNGFGFDSIFIPDNQVGSPLTLAEMSDEMRINYSARSLCFKQLYEFLKEDN